MVALARAALLWPPRRPEVAHPMPISRVARPSRLRGLPAGWLAVVASALCIRESKATACQMNVRQSIFSQFLANPLASWIDQVNYTAG